MNRNPLGKIALPVTFGDQKNFRTETIVFDVADTLLPYTSILGRPALAKFMAVSHFAYNMMKMPASWGVLTVKDDVGDIVLCVQKLNLAIAATYKEYRRLMLLHSTEMRRAPGAQHLPPPSRRTSRRIRR